MTRYISGFILLWFFLFIAGCYREQNRDAKADEKDQILTAEIAKRTLLEMDVRQIPSLIPGPEDVPIEVLDVDAIAVGRWRCNLKEKTFHASALYPEASRHRFNHVSGVFQRDSDGKWVAKVTDSSSGH